MLDPLILRAISICFGLLLLLAAVHKFSAVHQFRAVLEDYQVMPRALTTIAARLIPLIEIALGAGWLMGFKPQMIALATAALLATYTSAIALNLLRGRTHISCGCGFGSRSSEDEQLSVWLVLRNSFLVAVALVAIVPTSSRTFGLIDYVTLVTTLIAGVLLYSAANQLLANGAAIGTWRNRHD